MNEDFRFSNYLYKFIYKIFIFKGIPKLVLNQ